MHAHHAPFGCGPPWARGGGPPWARGGGPPWARAGGPPWARRHERFEGHGGCGTSRPNREEWLSALEEHQKDLEQQVADIADLIRRLKDEPEGEDAPADPT
jgi:hypothetical protein